MGSAKKDLAAMPEDVQAFFGYALYLAQTGNKHAQAKPIKGFGNAVVLEVVEDWQAMLTVPCTQCATPQQCMYCIASRRNRHAVSPRSNRTWI